MCHYGRAGRKTELEESSLVGERVRWTGERLHRGISELQEICFQSERFYASISVMSCFCASLVDRWKNILWTVARRLKARKKTFRFTFSLPSVLNIFTVVNSFVKWLHCQVSRRMRYVLSRTVLFPCHIAKLMRTLFHFFFCWSNSMCWLWRNRAESIWVCKFWYRFK